MIIDCISDLHGHYPELEGGDLLIVAGDLTATDTANEYIEDFQYWLRKQKYKRKVVIAGNHDNLLQNGVEVDTGTGKGRYIPLCDCDYLCDSGTEFQHFWTNTQGALCGKNFKIWGSPWTRMFFGQNPHCMAFALETEEELAEKFALIPKDTDILITHSPPYGILDQVMDRELRTPPFLSAMRKKRVGSTALVDCIMEIEPRLSVFGHIHEGYGQYKIDGDSTIYINASHMNEVYDPVNKPIRIIL